MKTENIMVEITPEQKWYVIRTKPRWERKVAAQIEKKEIEITYYETQARMEVERKSIENTNLKIETLRNAYKLATEIKDPVFTESLVGVIKEQLKTVVGISELPLGSFEPGTLERSILEKRILPPAAEIAGGDDPDFQVSASTEQPL